MLSASGKIGQSKKAACRFESTAHPPRNSILLRGRGTISAADAPPERRERAVYTRPLGGCSRQGSAAPSMRPIAESQVVLGPPQRRRAASSGLNLVLAESRDLRLELLHSLSLAPFGVRSPTGRQDDTTARSAASFATSPRGCAGSVHRVFGASDDVST
ncbi:hypothetical protein RI054_12g61650 [Pseudoscourfieldia marina]